MTELAAVPDLVADGRAAKNSAPATRGAGAPGKSAAVSKKAASSPKKANSARSRKPTPAKEYRASIYQESPSLPPKLSQPLIELERELGLPIWLLLQPDGSEHPLGLVDEMLVHRFRHRRSTLPVNQRIGLVLNSPGGSARCAYGLARILHRRCGGFVAIVPDAAMSAATLLTLGADQIMMGPDASLGPLDAQIMDVEAETYSSVLNEVQALERLRAYSLESVDETMQLLLYRTGKRIETLLPHVLHFVAESMQPLLDKIDVVHYNERARILKVGEEYAVRLLRRHFPGTAHSHLVGPPGALDEARRIASALVENYPEHGFWIDREEAQALGLAVMPTTEKQDAILDSLWQGVQGVTAIGAFEEVAP